MKKIALALTFAVVASPALAAGEPSTSTSAENPMAGWVPRKVTKESQDKKEIQTMFNEMENAGKKGDLETAASLVDFPVTMITDDSKGEAKGETWSREQWTRVMAPFYAKPMPGMQVTHKPDIYVLTDSLAAVHDNWTMKMGGKNVSGRSASLLVRRNGKWLVKAMSEGGWGDFMKSGQASAREPGGTSGTGAGTEPGAGESGTKQK